MDQLSKKNITFIVSDVEKAIAFEWIIEQLDYSRFNLSFVLINSEETPLHHFIMEKGLAVFTIANRGKFDLPASTIKCAKILKKLKSDVVHCHLLTANLVGLSAAKLVGIKNRIYTRHHSDYHHIYHKKAIKLDKYCNRLATKIISISDVVTEVLVCMENVPLHKIEKIWHGFKVEDFVRENSDRVNALREKYIPKNKKFVVGVISRATHWKGIQFIIPAFKAFLQEHPDAYLILFNPVGNYESEINSLLDEVPPDSFQKVYFENDITNLYKIFNVFVHVPISKSVEAFGQTYIECLLSGVPMIATRSGIGNDVMENNINCIEVPFEDSNAILQGLLKVASDRDFASQIAHQGSLSVRDKFSISNMINSLEKLYLQ